MKKPIGKLKIPKINVDAKIVTQKVLKDGIMTEPDCPDDVSFYNFSAWKGLGGKLGQSGNAIFAGHVDSGFKPCKGGTVPPPCEAVFWDLDKLIRGDLISLEIGKKKYTYKIKSNTQVKADGKSWPKILKSTKLETITIISCNGDFDPHAVSYDMRQVVKAKRINS